MLQLHEQITKRFDDKIINSIENEAAKTIQHGFSPYVDNGGTVLAIGGQDFAVCVADTRLSTGYRIHTRHCPKYTKLTNKCVIASSGMQADISTLHKVLQHEVRMYQYTHHRDPSVAALAQLLSTTLYGKRFFPYYAFNILVGLDENGTGTVYVYDAIGSVEKDIYAICGSGNALGVSVLDSQISRKYQTIPQQPLNKLQCIDLAKDVITSICERDIYTGDEVDVIVIDQAGVSVTKMPLKID